MSGGQVRLRLPEILEERGMTAYALSAASGGRIGMVQAYRLARRRGKVRYLDTQLLEALCDVLRVEPGELLERAPRRRRAAHAPTRGLAGKRDRSPRGA